MAAFASMGFGALNEVVEFAGTKKDKNVQVGGYENIASDLVANLLGAFSAAINLYVRHRAANS